MQKIELQIRPSDCDMFGHVNNAVYASFIQQAISKALCFVGLSEDWTRDGDFFWQLKSFTIEYRKIAVFGDDLIANTWLVQTDRNTPSFACGIKHSETTKGTNTPQTICRSLSGWNRISRQSGEAVPIPDSIFADIPQNGGSLPRSFKLPEDNRQIKKYFWNHTVMISEISQDGHVQPDTIFDWVQESIFKASEEAGWPLERRFSMDFVTFQTRHDTEYLAFPRVGDKIQVTSSAIEVGRLRGTWYNEVHRIPQDDLLVRDYSTGVFLNLSGRPTTPPAEMMKDIQFGKS